MLLPFDGLSVRAFAQQQADQCKPGNQAASPPTIPFARPLPILPVAQAVRAFNPAPTVAIGSPRPSCEVPSLRRHSGSFPSRREHRDKE